MKDRYRSLLKRTEVTVGATVGAILTLAIAGTLDLFLPLSEGGWTAAIRKSIGTHFGQSWEDVLWVQIAVGLAALLIMTVMGAVIGAFFGILITRFFRAMFKFIERHEE